MPTIPVTELGAAITNMNLKPQSKAMAAAGNEDMRLVINEEQKSYFDQRKPDYFVYLYSVTTEGFEINRAPYLPKLVIKGKPKDKEYVCVAKFPSPLVMKSPNIDSGEVEYKPASAQHFAMDLCNPDNLTLNQDLNTGAAGVDSSAGTNNIGKRGIFWSLNNPPMKDEIDSATKRMEAHYRALLEAADTIEASNPAGIKESMRPEWHHAANYFGENRSWHTVQQKPVECDLCGEKMKKAGLAFHRLENGGLCVKNWKVAYEAGVVEAQRVPMAKRWDDFYEETGVVKPAAPVAPVAPVAKAPEQK